MLIKYLRIEKGEQLIRHIAFKLGANLIVDATESDNLQDSGNNVGKTTVLKLIDYCFGAKSKAIYQDAEFKTNSKIKEFLENDNVIVTLCLGKSFANDDDDLVIRRNFLSRSNKLAEINGENITSDADFRRKLKFLLFQFGGEKPTFRELMPRYIRSESGSMDRVIKYLHQSTTNNTYEAIYRFLFTRSDTVELSNSKNTSEQKIKFNKTVVKNTFKNRTSEELEQHLAIVQTEISKIERDKLLFNVNPKYEQEYAELQNTKNEIGVVTSYLSKKQYRLQLLMESLAELEQQVSNIDSDALKSVYEEANLYIEDLQKSFDDVLGFHNRLVSNKQAYLSEEIPQLNVEILTVHLDLASLLEKEKELSGNLIRTGSLSDYERIVANGNKKYEQKGRLEEELSKLQELEKEILDNSEKINEIVDTIKKEAESFKENIKEFNVFFSDFSEKFYNEQFALSATFDDEDEVYKFSITNVEGSLGDGKKKGIIAAFDLAYIAYANSKAFATPQFAMHDRIEGIHGNQLRSLFDIVNSGTFEGQYIASVLRGKFSEFQLSENYLENNKILELSQNDKLFKVD